SSDLQDIFVGGRMAQAFQIVQQAFAICIAPMQSAMLHPERIDRAGQSCTRAQATAGQGVSLFLERNRDIQARTAFVEKCGHGAREVVEGGEYTVVVQRKAGLPGESLMNEGRTAVRDGVAYYAKTFGGCCSGHGTTVSSFWCSKCQVRV